MSKKIIIFFTLLTISAQNLLGEDQYASFVISLYTPAPAVPGEEITFQTNILNEGSETWEKNDYSYRVIIYNKSKIYVKETIREYGIAEIPGNTTKILENTLVIPNAWEGQYYYKVIFEVGGVDFESEMYEFWIKKPEKKKKELPLLTIKGGRFGIDYRYSSEYDDSLDLEANLYGNNVKNQYNLYTRGSYYNSVNSKDEFKLNYFSLGYDMPKVHIKIGDVSKMFSKYSLYYHSSRGGYCDLSLGNADISVVGANTVSGDTYFSPNYLYGTKLAYLFKPGWSASVNCLKNYDDKDNLDEFSVPRDNEVISVEFGSEIAGIELDFECARSKYDSDLTDFENADYDNAYSARLDYRHKGLNLLMSFDRIDPGFYSLGYEYMTNDKIDYSLTLSQRLKSVANFSLYGYYSTNNLDKVKTSNTTNTHSISLSGYTMFRKFPYLSYRLACSGSKSDDVAGYKTDNMTVSGSLGLSYTISRWFLSLNGTVSEYTNEVFSNSSTKSNSVSLNSSIPVIKNITLSTLLSRSLSRIIETDVISNYRNMQGSLRYNLKKFSSVLKMNLNTNNNSDDTIDNYTTSTGIELYYTIKKIRIDSNFTVSKYRNEITPLYDYDDTVFKIGMDYYF
jgi:hypothetical protein